MQETPTPKAPPLPRRKLVRVADEDLVTLGRLSPDGDLPLLVQPVAPDLDLAAWAAEHRGLLAEKLARHGGILFRGFPVRDPAQFQRVVEALSSGLLEYRERSSPRSRVEGNVYTSTDYPPDQPIFLHNENSYQQTWPLKLFFYCHVEPQEGGATPIADCRRVLERISPEVRQRFSERGWMVVRNFGDGINLPWPEVFQTHDRAEVEAYCARNGLQAEWRDGDRLRTRTVRRAIARHPATGEPTWFNHATFFHVSTLTAPVREALLAQFAEEDLPSNTYYGDGAPIEAEVLDQLRAAYRAETVTFPWRRGDVLMLDNLLVCHGRAPFRGPRKILVGMAEPSSWERV